ncbi:hypothetical protein H5J25_00550 [Sphingomonas aliaeris]|uniref:Zinc-binding dehydrogenase n=1 Tax=Sphingomonas aliaeris TaxID=2759526 RepID=A0A974NXN8_9SPHN|nr:hypothetical protein H5J25_00550 [Sphingomonas aliaeris]
MAAHIGDVEEYRTRARSMFDAVETGTIVPDVWRTYDVSEAGGAHADLEGGLSYGAIVLTPR